jgi:hypothetical protein
LNKSIVGAAIGSPHGNTSRNGRPMGAPTFILQAFKNLDKLLFVNLHKRSVKSLLQLFKYPKMRKWLEFADFFKKTLAIPVLILYNNRACGKG